MISFWISVVPPKTVFHRHRKAGLLRFPRPLSWHMMRRPWAPILKIMR